MIDPWPAGYYGAAGPLRQLAADVPAADVHAGGAVRARLRAAGRGADRHVRPRRHEGDRRRGSRVVPLPPTAGNYAAKFMFDANNRPAFTEFRDDVKPIEITQPDGPSFTVDGWKVQWQKWSLRIGFNPREGIVLHEITYTDRGETRPIMYRASLSEMVVPYGDTAPTHWNKNVFDMGEVGMGFSANPLTLGCDCLGEIHYFDATVNDSDGNAVTIPNAICMHEEDYGISWKHTDFRTEEVEVRRSRRLVDLDDLHGRQLRVRVLLVLLQRRVDRGRGQAVRRADHRRGRRRRGAAVGQDGRPEHLRPESPALLQLPARHERRRRGQQRLRGRFDPRAGPGAEPAPQRVDHPGTRWWRRRPTVRATGTGRPAGTGRSTNPSKTQRTRQPGRLQADAARHRAGDGAGGFLHLRPGAVRPAQPVGDQVRPGREVRGGRLHVPVGRRPGAAASTSPTTHRWRTPTWCSGTRSAPTTSCGRRTGR